MAASLSCYPQRFHNPATPQPERLPRAPIHVEFVFPMMMQMIRSTAGRILFPLIIILFLGWMVLMDNVDGAGI